MAMQASGNKKMKIWMEDVKCRGHEMTLEDCKFNNWQNKECSPKNVVSVKCEPGNYVQQSKILRAILCKYGANFFTHSLRFQRNFLYLDVFTQKEIIHA